MRTSEDTSTLDDLERVASHSITADYRRRIVEERVPVSASMELTMRCNLHCSHCYCPPGDRREELSTSEIKEALDRMAEMGTLYMLFTGGEPLLRKDFPDIYRHAKERGMLVTVFTNGTLIDERILALWDELPPHLVEISLYGATAETYEKVVATRGSFARCLQGIERLVARGHRLALKAPVTRENAHEIRELQDFARRHGLEFRYDPVILATMEGDRRTHALRLDPEEIVALEAADEEKDHAWRDYMAEEKKPIPDELLFACGAGRNSLHVDPYGNVQVCLMVKNFRHSLRERPMEEIFREEFPRIYSMRRDELSSCGGCEKRSICSNCPGAALWETRELAGGTDFACRLSEVRTRTYAGALDAAAPSPSAGSQAGCGSGGCGAAARGSSLLQIQSGGLS